MEWYLTLNWKIWLVIIIVLFILSYIMFRLGSNSKDINYSALGLFFLCLTFITLSAYMFSCVNDLYGIEDEDVDVWSGSSHVVRDYATQYNQSKHKFRYQNWNADHIYYLNESMDSMYHVANINGSTTSIKFELPKKAVSMNCTVNRSTGGVEIVSINKLITFEDGSTLMLDDSDRPMK